MSGQLDLFLHRKPRWFECEHPETFVTMSTVPAGDFCPSCETLVSQCRPEFPGEFSYLTADRAYFIRTGHWASEEGDWSSKVHTPTAMTETP
jgi:hypothetical protein